MNNEKDNILRYEELALNAFPAILTEFYDGWVLRYSNGYTFRGNSINPLYKSNINLDEKISYCESKFASKKLPCVFKMTEAVEDELDKLLEKKGYTIEKNADIMVHCLKNYNAKHIENYNMIESKSLNNINVHIEYEMTDEWLNQFLILNGTTDHKTKETAKKMLSSIKNKVFCASINLNDEMAACGLGVLEDGKVGLYDIRVLEEYRRKGLATVLCTKIIEAGIDEGAVSAYLQVASANYGAIRLYENLGFSKLYTYWYRVKKDENYNGKTE